MAWNPRISVIIAGALCGLVFSIPVIIVLSVITAAVAVFLTARTYNAELAFAIGLVAMIAALYFNLSMWLVAILLNGLVDFSIFSWMTR